MPSPSFTNIPLTLHSTAWLDGEVQQTKVTLPTGIPPFTLFEVQGDIKAFINQEPGLRADSGKLFMVTDVVHITAAMPGLDRPLDNFLIQSPITIRYPLELFPPVALRTVTIGDEFTVQWKVRIVHEISPLQDALCSLGDPFSGP